MCTSTTPGRRAVRGFVEQSGERRAVRRGKANEPAARGGRRGAVPTRNSTTTHSPQRAAPATCHDQAAVTAPQIVAHRLPQADEERPADKRVADRDLVQVRQGAEEREVAKVEIVAGIDAEAEVVRAARGVDIACRKLVAAATGPSSNARANGSV